MLAHNHAIVIRVLQGQSAVLPSGSTIVLGKGTTMQVTGSVTVEGNGTCIANVPVTVNLGSTVNTLSTCYAAGAVIPSDTRLLAGRYGPVTFTHRRHQG